MKFDLFYDSRGSGRIHGCRWMPKGEPRAVLQIVHGIAEHIECYEPLVKYLNAMGYVVVAEDHMGHGRSISEECPQGYFAGGWFAAVEDTCQLMRYTMGKFPDLPYILFGHSMGSFLVRTILAKYPSSGISAAVICGTGWQGSAMLRTASALCDAVCRVQGEEKPSPMLQKLMFGGYNKRIDGPKTDNDWLSRDRKFVDFYNDDPLCGFVPTAGLVRDMMQGITYIQKPDSLNAMRKDLPVLFIAGSDDPVGSYGDGVELCAQAFRDAGMERVAMKLYPECRHVIHQELNKLEVFADLTNWISSVTGIL